MFACLGPPCGPPGRIENTVERVPDGGNISRLAEAFEQLGQRLAGIVGHQLGERARVFDLSAAEIALRQGPEVSFDGAERNRDRTISSEVHLDVLELEIEIGNATHPLPEHLDNSSPVVVEPTFGLFELLEGVAGGRDRVSIEHCVEGGVVCAGGGETPYEPLQQLCGRLPFGQTCLFTKGRQGIFRTAGILEGLGQQLEEGPGKRFLS